MTITLSRTQDFVVKQEIGVAVQVLASAGSGKTRVLTERVRYILEQTKKDSVVALTFTNSAAAEMSERLATSGLDSDRLWVGTIHSVAQRMIEQYGYTIGLPQNVQIYERDQDRMEVFLESLREEGVNIDEYLNVPDDKEKKTRERNLQSYMDGFSTIKRDLLTESDIADKFPNNPGVWKVYNDYQNALMNSGGIDYDDILKFALKILETQEWVAEIYRAKFRHILVDEAQDLNKIQYAFVRAFAGRHLTSVMMVGDPNQMIYGFNGSSAEFLQKNFVQDFSPVCIKLTENFRSASSIVRAANLLRPGSQSEIEYAHTGGVSLNAYNNETEEADGIKNTIQMLLELGSHQEIEGPITLDKIVVIARNRFVFGELEKTLKSTGIPYSLRKGERMAMPTSVIGQTLDYGIRLRLNPKDWVDGKKLCGLLELNAPTSWSDQDVLRTFSDQLVTKPIKRRFDDILAQLLQSVAELNIEKPNVPKFIAGLISLLQDRVPTSDEAEVSEIERSISELDEFNLSWTRFRRSGQGQTLLAFQNAKALGKLVDDTETTGLTLSTVHTMKGLEKDIVFLMGLCEGVFPDYRAKTPDKLEEECNTAFVAVTRARRWLYLSYPEERLMPWGNARSQTRSRFVTKMGLR